MAATYRFSMQVIGRSKGRSATAAAAYRSGERIVDERTGQVHDYRARAGVLLAEILAPENAPAWMRDRAKLWNAIEKAEKRKDAQVCRELQLSLPHALTDAQRAELVRRFVREEFVRRGMVADLAIHRPDKEGDQRNHHAHVMLTMRRIEGDGFGQKERGWNEREWLEQLRERWAEHVNRSLELAGLPDRVDHRSLADQGFDREPEPKIGPVASAMERRGEESDRGDQWREVKARNEERGELHQEAEIIDFELAKIERQEQARREAEARAAQEKIAARQAAQQEAAARHAAERLRQTGEARQRQLEARRQAEARERGRFEAWGNARRAEAQSARHEAETGLGRTHQAEKLNLEAMIARDRAKLDTKHRPDLAAIKQRQQRKGLARFLYRVTGRAAEDQDQAARIERSFADFGRRAAERQQVLAAQQQQERANLDRAQERDAAQVEQRITRARERRELEGWTAQRERGARTGQTRAERARPVQREATTGREIDAEADNSPVDAFEPVEATHIAPDPSEAIHEPPTGQSEGMAEPTPEEQRQAELDARRAAMEARERDDRGRERER